MPILNTLPHNVRLPQHVVSAVSHRLLWVASITKNTSSAATHTINAHFVQSTSICLWQSAKSCIFAGPKYIMTSKVSKNRGIEQLPWNSNVEVLIFQLRYCLMPFYMLHICITLTPKFYGRKWHCHKGGSNNSEIGIWRYQKCFFWKFEREHSGLCDRTNFQKDTSESVQITFQNSRNQKTEFLEPPLNNKYLTLRLGSELLEMTNCCEAP